MRTLLFVNLSVLNLPRPTVAIPTPANDMCLGVIGRQVPSLHYPDLIGHAPMVYLSSLFVLIQLFINGFITMVLVLDMQFLSLGFFSSRYRM